MVLKDDVRAEYYNCNEEMGLKKKVSQESD